jgi:general secretion pathway protein G
MAIVLAVVAALASLAGTQYTKLLDRARVASAVSEMQAVSRLLDNLKLDETELPDTLAEVDAELVDPWGRPYEYLKLVGTLPPGHASGDPSGLPHVSAQPPGKGAEEPAQPRKDRFLVPINTDYDLYSRGADGQTEKQLDRTVSRDDVIRAANGGYFGLAENF